MVKRLLRLGLFGLGGLVAMLALLLLLLTQTPYGREQVRRLAMRQLAPHVNGSVGVQHLGGNLLRGVTLSGLSVRDSAGQPLFTADTLVLHYRFTQLLRRRLAFYDARLVQPTVVLDQLPGQSWNFQRIFHADTLATPTDTAPGFGSWVSISNLVVVAGEVTVRTAWQPDSGLTAGAREATVRSALGSGNRQLIVPAPGGYQSVTRLRAVDALLPRIRLADPDSSARLVEIAHLSATALPFRPPVLEVRDAQGVVAIAEDTVEVRDLRVSLPGSQLQLAGWYDMLSGAANLRVLAPTLAFQDLRFAYPDLPVGGGRADIAFARNDGAQRLVASNLSLSVADAHLAGNIDVQTDTTIRLGPSEIEFRAVDTRLLAQLVPAFASPVEGVLAGHLQLAGSTRRLRLDGWSAISDRSGATSRVTVAGELENQRAGLYARALTLRFEPLHASLASGLPPGLPPGATLTGHATVNGRLNQRLAIDADLLQQGGGTGPSHVLVQGQLDLGQTLAARDLRLSLQPLQLALVRHFRPGLPLAGALTGHATLNGAPARGLAAKVELTHDGVEGTSTVAGDVAFSYRGELRRITADLQLEPFALATAGRFVPAAGLHGTASGTISARGDGHELAFSADLSVAGGGRVAADGTITPGQPFQYDVAGRFSSFDPSALTDLAPGAGLTGTVTAAGSGASLATAAAQVDAVLVDSRLPGALRLDTTHVRVRLAGGLATFKQGHVRLASMTADVQGSFGLDAGRSGELRYALGIDSLADLPGLPPGDTVEVQPRPLRQQRRLAAARADSAAFVRATEVERAATGQPPIPPLQVDTVRPIARDSVAGSLRASGVLAGNIGHFTATGSASLERLVWRGNALRRGALDYRLERAPDRPFEASLAARLGDVQTAGFGFDSASIEVRSTGDTHQGEGSARAALFQDADHDYHLSSEFTLASDRRELRLSDVELRFDSTLWRNPQPGRVSWAKDAVQVDHVELERPGGGRLSAAGRVALADGSSDLQLEVGSLQLANVAALLQDTASARGLLSLQAKVAGSATAPRITGQLSLDSATNAGLDLPSVRGSFDYGARLLNGELAVTRGSADLFHADVALPVDLAFRERQGPLLLRQEPFRLDARADSMPLQALPGLPAGVSDLRGVLNGEVGVRGSIADPTLTGRLDLGLNSLRLPQAGLLLTGGSATMRLQGDRAALDSLVIRSGRGVMRAHGTVDLTEVTRPGFDLTISSRDALLLDNENGRVYGDVDLAVAGPYQDVRITGDLAIRHGVIYVPDPTDSRRVTNIDDPTLVAVLDTLGVAPESRHLPPAILRNLQLDIGIRVAHDTWVRNHTANVEIYTPTGGVPVRLTMDNARQAFLVEGTINADRGEYTVAGRQFALTAGSVTFLGTPELDPLLQLNAQYLVPRLNQQALTIQIAVGGYLSQPRITLSSNAQPPLPESDLISYLAFGRSSSSLIDLGGSGVTGSDLGVIAEQQIAGLGLGAFVDAWVSGLEERGTRAGLDVFRVHPAKLPEELNVGGYFQNVMRGMEVEAGKYLTPRFYLSAKGRLSGAPPGLRLDWQRSGGWSWYATWEPGYLPSEPSFDFTQPTRTQVFGSFLRWKRRF